MYERTGARAVIYTSPSFWRSALNDSRWFADNGYAIPWVAPLGRLEPVRPREQLGRPILDVLAVHEQRDGPGDLRRVDLNRYRFSTFDAVTY